MEGELLFQPGGGLEGAAGEAAVELQEMDSSCGALRPALLHPTQQPQVWGPPEPAPVPLSSLGTEVARACQVKQVGRGLGLLESLNPLVKIQEC